MSPSSSIQMTATSQYTRAMWTHQSVGEVLKPEPSGCVLCSPVPLIPSSVVGMRSQSVLPWWQN